MTTWHSLLSPAMTRFRRRRMERVVSLIPDFNQRSVLDLGGSVHFWDAIGPDLQPKAVTLLNIKADGSALGDRNDLAHRIVIYDGKTIPFGDGEVDLLFCNSVIEHVPVDARPGLVAEMKRVAREYVVQTPAQEFPLEPHFVTPFIHWLPRTAGRSLSVLTPFRLVNHMPPSDVQTYFDETKLLTRAEIRALFPNDSIETEQFLGMTKSYVVHGRRA